MNKKIELKDMLIDLVFAKNCEIKEVSYQQDELVCDDLLKMKEELKETLNVLFEEYKEE